MNFDQVILSMINDKMLQNNRISPELHQNIQRDILLMTTPVSSNTELTETVDNESDNCYTEKVMWLSYSERSTMDIYTTREVLKNNLTSIFDLNLRVAYYESVSTDKEEH